MKFKSLSIKGAVPFPELVSIKFPDAKKIALVGGNGAGKSTVFDCILAALYGSVTKPHGIYSLFKNSKEGLIDLTFEMDGHEYRIKRLIDGVGRKQKPFFYCNGQPITEGKVSEFDDLVRVTLGLSEKAFLASVYNCQTQKGNPLSLNDRERRDLLTEVLGLGQFDGPLALVAEDASGTQKALDTLHAKRDVLLSDPLVMSDLTETKSQIEEEITSLETQIKEQEEAAQNARQAVANAKANAQNLDEMRRQIELLQEQIKSAQERKAEVEAKIKKNEDELLGKAEAIRAAVTETEKLEFENSEAEKRIAEAEAEITKLEKERQEQILEKRDSLDALKNSVDAVKDNLQRLENNKKTLEYNISAKEANIANLKPQTALLTEVPCVDTDYHGRCKLLVSVFETKNLVQDAENSLPQSRLDLVEVESQISKVFQDLGDQEKLFQVEREAFDEFLKVFPGGEKKQYARQMKEFVCLNRDRIQELAPLVKNAPFLEGVDERMEGYRNEIADFDKVLISHAGAIADARNKLDEASQLAETIARHEAAVLGCEAQKGDLQRSRDAKVSQIGDIEAKIKRCQEIDAKLLEIGTEVGKLSGRMSLLGILKEGLGPKGARALKIDSAGPEISELVNALLRECYGSKFTIAIKTLRELASKDGEMRECLEFSIIDNETGEETPVENKSGGEQQLIKEVISLGLCIYQRRRAGVDTRTIIRDESCSALTEANTELYVKMLDRAAVIGGFDQILYVSHKSVAQNLADAVILIQDGGARVMEG